MLHSSLITQSLGSIWKKNDQYHVELGLQKVSVSAFKEVCKYSAQHPAEQDSDHTSWSSGELIDHTFGPVMTPGCFQRQWWSQSRNLCYSIKNCNNYHQHYFGLGSITRNDNSPCMHRSRISKSPQCCWPKSQSGESCLQWKFTADLPVFLLQ